MCHVLNFKGRLPAGSRTLAPADLLLTKLQIVEVNDKDLIDSVALVLKHPISQNDQDSIDLRMLREVVGDQWGWYTTISDNLVKVAQRLSTVGLSDAETETVSARVQELQAAMEAFPKTLKWRARSIVGRKVPWYDLPEEVE
jgi:predicted GNAT family acetyltransferase